jgi:hypothetical protein
MANLVTGAMTSSPNSIVSGYCVRSSYRIRANPRIHNAECVVGLDQASVSTWSSIHKPDAADGEFLHHLPDKEAKRNQQGYRNKTDASKSSRYIMPRLEPLLPSPKLCYRPAARTNRNVDAAVPSMTMTTDYPHYRRAGGVVLWQQVHALLHLGDNPSRYWWYLPAFGGNPGWCGVHALLCTEHRRFTQR